MSDLIAYIDNMMTPTVIQTIGLVLVVIAAVIILFTKRK